MIMLISTTQLRQTDNFVLAAVSIRREPTMSAGPGEGGAGQKWSRAGTETNIKLCVCVFYAGDSGVRHFSPSVPISLCSTGLV